MTQTEILNQRAKQYGSYVDNALFVSRFFEFTSIKFVNIRVMEDKYPEFYSISSLTKNMAGLKIARLAHSSSTESIEDSIKDYFNYWFLGIKDLLRSSTIVDIEHHYIYVEFDDKQILANKDISKSANLKYIIQCINLIKDEKWNNTNLEELQQKASAVIDTYHKHQDTIDDEDINLFNYKEKLKSRK